MSNYYYCTTRTPYIEIVGRVWGLYQTPVGKNKPTNTRKWTWTTDQKIFSLLLYQLSYPSIFFIYEQIYIL